MLGTLAVLFGIALVVGISYAAGTDRVELSNLGDEDFKAGNAEHLAEGIIEDQRPHLFGDASPNKARDIWLQHIGRSDDEGWIAISAGPRECSLQWDMEGKQFVDPCTGETHPPDGGSLTRYRTYVEDGTVYVDLRTTVE